MYPDETRRERRERRRRSGLSPKEKRARAERCKALAVLLFGSLFLTFLWLALESFYGSPLGHY